MPLSRLAPIALLLLVICFFWKLTMTAEFVWFDHPDMVYIEIPRLQFQAREFHAGHFPLWDPSIWAGQSLIGQTQPGPLFPPQLLFLLAPLRDGYLRPEYLNWYWVALHAIAALSCYALCRDWGRSRGASILAGIGFGCGGFLGTVAWVDVAAGVVFLPLIALYLSRALDRPRPWTSAALAGLFLGLSWLCGHHEVPLLMSLVFLTLWAALAWLDRRRWPLAAVSIAVAVLIASAQVLATVEFGRLSKRWVGAAEPVGWNDTIPYTIATIYSMPARGILQTFLPSADRYADCAPFIGLAIVTMALAGFAWGGPRARWLGLLAGVSLLFALGAATPLHGSFYSLIPGLGKARIPVRALALFHFALSVLAAYGMDALLARAEARRGRWLAWGLAGLGAVVLGWAIGGAPFDDRMILSGFLALGLAATLFVRVQPAAFAALWIAAAMVELHGVSTATYSSKYREDQNRFRRLLDENKDIADFLRAQERDGPVRLDVKESEMPMNFGDYHGVDALGGYLAGVPDNILRAETHTERSKTLLAVTHYLAKAPERPEQIAIFAGKSGLKVFRNPEARPRVWSVHEAASVNTESALRERIQVAPIHLHRQTVLLGDAPPLESCDGDEVKLLSRSPNRVRIAANMRCRGMVILGDSFYPGWEARVDGQPTRVWEAYGFLRGAVTPAGKHEVEFRFRPGSVYTGLACFAVGLLLTAGVAALRR